jgi:hypothetical protein
MPRDEWSEDSVARILVNPLYCLVEPAIVSEDQWIKANAKMIREMGEEAYLATLLNVLRGVREFVGDRP